MLKLNLSDINSYCELPRWCEDSLIDKVRECIELQKRAVTPILESKFKPDKEAAVDSVAEKTLLSILQSGKDVHGISSERHISNVIPFNAENIPNAVSSIELLELRKSVDKLITEKIWRNFEDGLNLKVICSGHFWYPPGAYMGWHTNSGAPGWRMYLSHSEEPGKSFFRYRDPETEEIITSKDNLWDIRLFEIRKEQPLWHTVYSETNRFSLGYMIYRESMLGKISRNFKRLLGR